VAIIGSASVEIHALLGALSKEIKTGLSEATAGQGDFYGTKFGKEFGTAARTGIAPALAGMRDEVVGAYTDAASGVSRLTEASIRADAAQQTLTASTRGAVAAQLQYNEAVAASVALEDGAVAAVDRTTASLDIEIRARQEAAAQALAASQQEVRAVAEVIVAEQQAGTLITAAQREASDARFVAAREAVTAAEQEVAAADAAATASRASAQVIVAAQQEEAAARVAAADEARIAALQQVEADTVVAESAAREAAAVEAAAMAEGLAYEEAAARDKAAAVEVEAANARKSASMKLVGLGIAVVAAAVTVEAVKMAANFQQSTERLVTSAGESKANLEVVRDGILAIAGSVGYSSEELSKAMYKIESGGQHGADGLVVLKAAAQGAKTENADLTVVSDALTSALTDYHLPASAAADVTSKLVAATSQGKMTFQDLANSMSSVLPIASANHVSMNDLLGDLASMTVHGITAQQATQNLADTIKHMAAPTMVQSKELAILGINSQQLSMDLGTKGLSGTIGEVSEAITSRMGPAGKVVINLQDALRPLPASVQKLGMALIDGSISFKDYRKAANDLDPVTKAQAMNFASLASNLYQVGTQQNIGKDAMQTYTDALRRAMGDQTGMNVAMMIGGENTAKTTESIKIITGATADASGAVKGWDEIQSTFNVKLDQASAGFGALAIKIGTMLLPVLTAVLGAIVPVVQWMANNSVVAGTLAVVIGGVLVLAIAAVTVAVWSWVTATLGLDLALWPVTLVILGVAAAILIFTQNSDAITKSIGEFVGMLKAAFLPIWNNLVDLWNKYVVPAWDNLVSKFKDPGTQDALKKFGDVIFNQILPALGKLAAIIVGDVIPALINIVAFLMPFILAITGFVADSIIDTVVISLGILGSALSVLAGSIQFVVDILTGKWGAALDDAKGVAWDLADGILKAFGLSAAEVDGWSKDTNDALVKWATDTQATVGAWGTDFNKTINDALGLTADNEASWNASFLGTIENTWNQTLANTENFSIDFNNKINDTLGIATTSQAKWDASIPGQFEATWTQVTTATSAWGTNFNDTINNALGITVDNQDKFWATYQLQADYAHAKANGTLDEFGKTYNARLAAINQMSVDDQEKWSHTFIGWISTTWQGVQDTVGPWGDSFNKSINDALGIATDSADAWNNSMPGQIEAAWQPIVDSVTPWSEKFNGAINDALGIATTSADAWNQSMPGQIEAAWQPITDSVGPWSAKFNGAINDALGIATTSADTWNNSMPGQIEAAWQPIIDSVKPWSEKFNGAINDALGIATTNADAWNNSMPGQIEAAWQPITDSVKPWSEKFNGAINDALGIATTSADTWNQSMPGQIAAAYGPILDGSNHFGDDFNHSIDDYLGKSGENWTKYFGPQGSISTQLNNFNDTLNKNWEAGFAQADADWQSRIDNFNTSPAHDYFVTFGESSAANWEGYFGPKGTISTQLNNFNTTTNGMFNDLFKSIGDSTSTYLAASGRNWDGYFGPKGTISTQLNSFNTTTNGMFNDLFHHVGIATDTFMAASGKNWDDDFGPKGKISTQLNSFNTTTNGMFDDLFKSLFGKTDTFNTNSAKNFDDNWGPKGSISYALNQFNANTNGMFDDMFKSLDGKTDGFMTASGNNWDKDFGAHGVISTQLNNFNTTTNGMFDDFFRGLGTKTQTELDRDGHDWLDTFGTNGTIATYLRSFNPIISGIFEGIWSGIKAGVRIFLDFLGDQLHSMIGDFAIPINFVIVHVFNDGLIAGWNNFMKWMNQGNEQYGHINNMATIPGFATGGEIPMTRGARRGVDSVLIKAMPGEYVLSTEDVASLGGITGVEALRSHIKGFAGGGIIPVPTPVYTGTPTPITGTQTGNLYFTLNGIYGISTPGPPISVFDWLIDKITGTPIPGDAPAVQASVKDEVKKASDAALNAVKDAILQRDTAAAAAAGRRGGGGSFQYEMPNATMGHELGYIASAPPAVGGNAALVQRLAAQLHGWADFNWNDLYALLTRESHFDNNIKNPTSSAYGMFQFLDSTWAGYGIAKTSDPTAQTIAGLNYIKNKYGDPIHAWTHETAYGWYDQGGWLPTGMTNTFNNTGKPEAIIPDPITSFKQAMREVFGQLAPDLYEALSKGAKDQIVALADRLAEKPKTSDDIARIVAATHVQPTESAAQKATQAAAAAAAVAPAPAPAPAPQLTFQAGAFQVVIHGNADAVTVGQLQATMKAWGAEILHQYQGRT
jgi:hypothetical protein